VTECAVRVQGSPARVLRLVAVAQQAQVAQDS
jgi:hypothetical protein